MINKIIRSRDYMNFDAIGKECELFYLFHSSGFSSLKPEQRLTLLQELENIEAKKMAVKALEKQRQKKIETWNGQASCPCCKKLFGEMKTIRNLTTWEMPYCKFCGQALDWSDEQ